MNKKSVLLISAFLLLCTMSCNDPETIVTNYVHPDGSITRKIEMRSIEGDIQKRFKIADIQVPFDSTWNVKDSCEISEKGDTLWVRRAVKNFKSINEINLSYSADSGSNRSISRSAGFKKRFRWFNTEFRFSERIEKRLSYGYPVKDFLNNQELLYFYSPETLKDFNTSGADSLKYRAIRDSVKIKTDKWSERNLVSEWIGEFSKLTSVEANSDKSIQSLRTRETELMAIVEKDNKVLDSLWKNGIILSEFIGETSAKKYKTQADSAISMVTNTFMKNFNNYSVRIVMPGKITGTNGFIDSSKLLIWPVTSDYFLSEPYEMWAESKTPNRWAWVVTGLFVLFVVSGVVRRQLVR